jgi:hypothetical protein
MERDANTKFFHLYANGRRRKKIILSLETDHGVITDKEGLRTHATTFYKSLFGSQPQSILSLSSNFWAERGMLSEEGKDSLIKPFFEEEVRRAIFEMRVDSAPGPNGFVVQFLKSFWSIIKGVYMAMIKDFHEGVLDIKRLNYGVITLVPKLSEANNIKQYRPICLFTKTLTNRFTPLAKEVIGPNQTGFVKGRNILEGVLILHEVIHELKRTKGKGLILKIDFEKAYDKVRWDFLEIVMRGKGFPTILYCFEWYHDGRVCLLNLKPKIDPLLL